MTGIYRQLACCAFLTFAVVAATHTARPGIGPAPVGPITPRSGWRVLLADDFNRPLGPAPGEDNLWYPSDVWNPNLARNVAGDNGYETEVYNATQTTVSNGRLVLTARYQQGVGPATGDRSGRNGANEVQRNYVSGLVSSRWSYVPRTGSTMAFEIVCRFPPNGGEMFNAFWTSSVGDWKAERDFFEGHSHHQIDTDWIYRTQGPSRQEYYRARLRFNPSTAMHRYTYVIFPNQSWSLYVDRHLQTWVGNQGVAPPRNGEQKAMNLIINYALTKTTWRAGTRAFIIRSVAVYEDGAHAGSSAVAPGTTVAAGS